MLSVIDWEDAIVGPWELVEFDKELSVVPPRMDGPLYKDSEASVAKRLARAEYVGLVREAERDRGLDSKLSRVLSDDAVQSFAHAFWRYADGRIGLYDRVLELLDDRCPGFEA